MVSTLPQPERHPHIPKNAQWLGGEGAGSWFVLGFQEKLLRLTRYSPDGIVECGGLYEDPREHLPDSNGHLPDPNDFFRVSYPSNCKEVNLLYNDKERLLKRIETGELIRVKAPSASFQPPARLSRASGHVAEVRVQNREPSEKKINYQTITESPNSKRNRFAIEAFLCLPAEANIRCWA